MDDLSRWASPIITLMGALCMLAASLAILRYKADVTKEKQKELRENQVELKVATSTEIDQLRRDHKDATAALNDTVTQMKIIVAEQAVLNRMTTQTLTGITEQIKIHEKDINELKTAIGILREVLRNLDVKLDKIHED